MTGASRGLAALSGGGIPGTIIFLARLAPSTAAVSYPLRWADLPSRPGLLHGVAHGLTSAAVAVTGQRIPTWPTFPRVAAGLASLAPPCYIIM